MFSLPKLMSGMPAAVRLYVQSADSQGNLQCSTDTTCDDLPQSVTLPRWVVPYLLRVDAGWTTEALVGRSIQLRKQ